MCLLHNIIFISPLSKNNVYLYDTKKIISVKKIYLHVLIYLKKKLSVQCCHVCHAQIHLFIFMMLAEFFFPFIEYNERFKRELNHCRFALAFNSVSKRRRLTRVLKKTKFKYSFKVKCRYILCITLSSSRAKHSSFFIIIIISSYLYIRENECEKTFD